VTMMMASPNCPPAVTKFRPVNKGGARMCDP